VSGTRYSLDEAQALLPEARTMVGRAVALVADLQRLLVQLEEGSAPASAVDDVGALEAGVDATFAWFERRGLRITSLSPALLDFPARAILDGEPVDVLLCWRDDEDTIAYYHEVDAGYRGRRPVALLDRV
jgi:hypothetical protein